MWPSWAGASNQERARETASLSTQGLDGRIGKGLPFLTHTSHQEASWRQCTPPSPPLKDLTRMRPSLKRQELWMGSRPLILENKDGCGCERPFKEEAKTLAPRNGLCDGLHKPGGVARGATYIWRRHHYPRSCFSFLRKTFPLLLPAPQTALPHPQEPQGFSTTPCFAPHLRVCCAAVLVCSIISWRTQSE